MARGDFRKALGPKVAVDSTIFNAGPSVIEAMFANRIDLAYIGPNPAVNGYIQSEGKALRVIAGATSGGAAFVVREDSGIQSPADLAGKKIATPQLGNTQDVALRDYLKVHGLSTTDKGGNVEIFPTPNPEIFDLFIQGRIDGAWVPEPWASRLVWRSLADSFPVVYVPPIAIAAILLVVPAALAVANLLAALPARAAARIRPAEALRVE
jgi:NitT/TauT family transport system substrate-binding protein